MKKLFPLILPLCLMAVMASAQDTQPLSQTELLQMAGDKYASGELPLGDGHYTINEARKGYIDLCRKFGQDGAGGAGRDGPWIHGDTWNIRQKLSVQGHVQWPDAQFSDVQQGNARIISGNGLPTNHATGVFPIQPNDPASAYDRNPNSIKAQNVQETLPVNPVYSATPFCMGMEVGYMLNGVPLFNGFDAGLRDAAAHEVQDSCQGHPQVSGSYHYHSLSSCIRDASVKTVIGYALDGFPITGPMVAAGKYLTTGDLDVCHGMTSEVIEDGKQKVTYHYVMTEDFPYSVSCFRAQPVRTGPPQGEGRGSGAMPMNASMQRGGMQGGAGGNGMHHPPQQALDACNGRNDGDSCGFTSPRGDRIDGTCHMPPSSALACIPSSLPPPQ